VASTKKTTHDTSTSNDGIVSSTLEPTIIITESDERIRTEDSLITDKITSSYTEHKEDIAAGMTTKQTMMYTNETLVISNVTQRMTLWNMNATETPKRSTPEPHNHLDQCMYDIEYFKY